MQITNIHEAKTPLAEGVGERSEHFSKIINRVIAGEEVIIGKAGKPVAKLIPYVQNDEPRCGGQWRGKVKIADDFDELPEHLAAAFRGETETAMKEGYLATKEERAILNQEWQTVDIEGWPE